MKGKDMTSDEIKMWARYAAMQQACAGRIVYLARDDGLLLQRDGSWSNDATHARRFHFDRDNVRAQIEEVEDRFGKQWDALPV